MIGADAEIRPVLHRALERAGFTTVERSSLSEGIAESRTTPTNLLILNVTGAGIDGLEGVLELGADRPALEILVICGEHGAPRDVEKRLGARRILKRPFGEEQLLQVIDGITRLREALHEMRKHPRFPTRTPATILGDHGQGRGGIVNLSLEGWAMESDLAPGVGSLPLLHLTIPGRTAPLPVDAAAVRWPQGQRCGVQFPWMEPSAQETLKESLRELASP